jgi:hypothetical protein
MNWNKIYFTASKQFCFIILLSMLSLSLICYIHWQNIKQSENKSHQTTSKNLYFGQDKID